MFPRFHQFHAVRRLLEAARVEGPGRSYLVQHSAGSGKSNTIAWLVHGLSRLHTPHAGARGDLGPDVPVFDKTVVITDRLVLDRQRQETVTGFSHTPGSIVTIGDGRTSTGPRAVLESRQAPAVITTLQKFSVVAQAATELAGTRFAVVVDEAHSSQTGEAARDLKAVLGDAEIEDVEDVEQQQVELASDHDIRAVALHNDEEQFRVFVQPRIEQSILERHESNGELFDSCFPSDERRELVDDFLVRGVYTRVRAS